MYSYTTVQVGDEPWIAVYYNRVATTTGTTNVRIRVRRASSQPALVDPWRPSNINAPTPIPVWPVAIRRFRGDT
jgi:hypothetical protein